jgi:hypothetical protein
MGVSREREKMGFIWWNPVCIVTNALETEWNSARSVLFHSTRWKLSGTIPQSLVNLEAFTTTAYVDATDNSPSSSRRRGGDDHVRPALSYTHANSTPTHYRLPALLHAGVERAGHPPQLIAQVVVASQHSCAQRGSRDNADRDGSGMQTRACGGSVR